MDEGIEPLSILAKSGLAGLLLDAALPPRVLNILLFDCRGLAGPEKSYAIVIRSPFASALSKASFAREASASLSYVTKASPSERPDLSNSR